MQQSQYQPAHYGTTSAPNKYGPGANTNPALNAMTAAALQAVNWSSAPTPPVLGGDSIVSASKCDAPTSYPTNRSKPQWPPCFETEGGAYVFQAASGYFYEPVSEYYYCPKSKLYYNSDTGAYFRYEPGLNPPFVLFNPPLPLMTTTTTSTEISAATTESALKPEGNGVSTAGISRKPVVMSIGFGGNKGTKPKAAATAPIVNTATKGVFENIAKWGSIRDQDDSEKSVVESTTTNLAVEKTTSPTLSLSEVAAVTASGSSYSGNANAIKAIVNNTAPVSSNTEPGLSTKPVCLLCRRQFNSADQLLRHEKESKLHAENLAKLSSS